MLSHTPLYSLYFLHEMSECGAKTTACQGRGLRWQLENLCLSNQKETSHISILLLCYFVNNEYAVVP